METIRLVLFTSVWTAVWAAPLPKLSRRVELVTGLITFAAFGLRVFGACFIGVPAEDPVRMAVAPLVDWINGVSGVVPFQWVLDLTVAIGLVWLASIANISRRQRLATIWVMPAVALASLASLRITGLPLGVLIHARFSTEEQRQSSIDDQIVARAVLSQCWSASWLTGATHWLEIAAAWRGKLDSVGHALFPPPAGGCPTAPAGSCRATRPRGARKTAGAFPSRSCSSDSASSSPWPSP